MAKPEELIAAGALLSASEKTKDESLVDTISARSYRHPALGARPVVRLTADNLAEGEDLTMEFLGFEMPHVAGPIAKRQRQALGFPGWAIVNDPKHARYALELVKEFKRAVRRSKAKPGFGYEEFTEISKRLGKSVAHFLPSFWEQAGREFIAFDNAMYGSRCFGKAREAEKVHALKVDEKLRQEAFLEFALAGAVSIKAITEYGKELLSTHDANAAWKFFRELCVRRTLGGMPPWSSMAKDLQPLIKAAKLNPESEFESILLEIIDSPAVSSATMSFWESSTKVVGQMAKNNPHVAGVLLNLIPQTSSWQRNDIWPWLDHLQAWGILSNAWKEKVPEEAAPQGGPVAWLTRLMHTFERPRQVIYDIVEQMADRLRKDKLPADLYLKRRWINHVFADVDLLDLALELKIPFTEPAGSVTLDLKQWAEPEDPKEQVRNRPRNPVHLASDSRFAQALHDALEKVAGEPAFEVAATGKSALREARKKWLGSLIEGLHTAGLPRLEDSLALLESKTRAPIFQEFPDLLRQLQQVDARPAITKTLGGGIIDEYGWPELERLYDSLTAANNQTPPMVFAHFPYVILSDRQKAVVLKGEDVVYEAELKLPKKHELKVLRYLDGDFLVWATVGNVYTSVCFWNSDPQPTDPEYQYFLPEFFGVTVDVPSGGTFMGEKIVHRGNKEVSSLRALDSVVHDGTHWWLKSADYDPATFQHVDSLVEVDPVTGKTGRKSLPSFFEDYIQDGAKLEVKSCGLLPVGDVFPKSPLGVREGRIGSRVRMNANGTRRVEGIDGRAFENASSHVFEVLLDQPGTTERLPVERRRQGNDVVGFTLWDPTGTYELTSVSGGGDGHSRGQVVVVSAHFFHALQVRDLAASKKLRAITDKDVHVLLEAGQRDFDNFTASPATDPAAGSLANPPPRAGLATVMGKLSARDEAAHSPLLDDAIRKLLGKDVNARLLTGLRGVIIRAGQRLRQLAKLVENRSAAPAAPKQAINMAAADATSAAFLGTLRPGYGSTFQFFPHVSFMESVIETAKFFSGEIPQVRFPQFWLYQLRKITEGAAQLVWKTYCSDPEKQDWIPFAETWSRLPYLTLPGWFRLYRSDAQDHTLFAAEQAALKADGEETGHPQQQIPWAIPYAGKSSRYLIENSYNGYDVLEYSADGNFESIPRLPENRSSEFIIKPSVWSAEQLRTFISLAKEKPLQYPPVKVLQALASDAKVSPAEVALIWFGFPGLDTYVSNFMPAHLREACKLKTKECSAAKESLKHMKANLLHALMRAVVDGEPADLWEQPPAKVADRIRAAWKGEQSDRLQLGGEWIEKLSETFDWGFNKAQFFQSLNAPLKSPLFSDRGTWGFRQLSGRAEVVCQDETCKFDQAILKAAADTFSMLAYGLPVDDPTRNKLIELHQALANAVNNPGLLLSAGYRYIAGDQPVTPQLIQLMESIVGKRKTQDSLDISEDGPVIVARDDQRLHIAFRPQQLTKAAVIERASNQVNALQGAGDESFPNMSEAFEILKVFRSTEFQAIVERIKQTPVAKGAFESNPQQSVPDVVKQVAKKHKLTDDAAAYYLQLLTLADPTDKNIALWNGWTTATIKKVGGELVDKKLVLEASRSRAGRKFFLPGGWEDLKAPHLPIESWKLPLFQITRDYYERMLPPLSRIVPLEPVHTLFAKAWQRTVDGDAPKYEEVK